MKRMGSRKLQHSGRAKTHISAQPHRPLGVGKVCESRSDIIALRAGGMRWQGNKFSPFIIQMRVTRQANPTLEFELSRSQLSTAGLPLSQKCPSPCPLL